MVTICFVFTVIILFVGVLSCETPANKRNDILHKPLSLWDWLTTGNWPAKFGATLLIVGIGALLRYALLNIDIPNILKIGSGVVISLLFAGAALALKPHPKQRALSLAFAGTSLAVAYLTAFSAYCLFNYMSQEITFGILIATCAVGAVIAIKADALSVALLAMFGAYLAPTFSLLIAPLPMLFVYYMTISASGLCMSWRNGWRPPMHLSFLFTMLGGLPFTSGDKWFYPGFFTSTPIEGLYFSLLLLQILHIVMPLVVSLNKDKATTQPTNTDTIYLWFVAITTWLLVPEQISGLANSIDVAKALIFVSFSVFWGIAAFVSFKENNRFQHYAIIAALFLLVGLYYIAPDMPWTWLILLATTVIFHQANRLSLSKSAQDFLCYLSVLVGLYYILTSSSTWDFSLPLSPTTLLYDFSAAGLLALTGYIANKRQTYNGVIHYVLGGFFGVTIIFHEIAILDLPPAFTSILVAFLSALCIVWSHHKKSRQGWICGMAFLFAATIKLLFFDFGSLGDLLNIFAVIATGALFLLISWLSPYPPAAVKSDNSTSEPIKGDHSTNDLSIPPQPKNTLSGLGKASLILCMLNPIGAILISMTRSNGSEGQWFFWLIAAIFLLCSFVGIILGLIAYLAKRDSKELTGIGIVLLTVFISMLCASDIRHFRHHSTPPFNHTVSNNIKSEGEAKRVENTPQPSVPAYNNSPPIAVAPPQRNIQPSIEYGNHSYGSCEDAWVKLYGNVTPEGTSACSDPLFAKCMQGFLSLDGTITEGRMNGCKAPIFSSCVAEILDTYHAVDPQHMTVCNARYAATKVPAQSQ